MFMSFSERFFFHCHTIIKELNFSNFSFLFYYVLKKICLILIFIIYTKHNFGTRLKELSCQSVKYMIGVSFTKQLRKTKRHSSRIHAAI